MPVRYEPSGAVVLITIDRPEVMNALDTEHNDALRDAFRRYEQDDDLRCAILTGPGDTAFSAGADLHTLIPKHREAVRAGLSPRWELGGITGDVYGKPKIAALNGHALAGGLELALACDIRIAIPDATLGLSETKWAIIPGAGGTQRLPRAVPLGAAFEMILTGDPISAVDALRLGLINRIVARDELLSAAMRLAEMIGRRGPLAAQAAREAMLKGLGLDLASGLECEQDLFLRVMRSQDAEEGTTAFDERREPEYLGR